VVAPDGHLMTRKDGVWEEWAANGVYLARQPWKAGVPHGDWYNWEADGTLRQVLHVREGKVVRLELYAKGSLTQSNVYDGEGNIIDWTVCQPTGCTHK